MDQMEIISASGKIKSQATDGNSIKVEQPGATVKVTLQESEISGAKKIDNNLVLMKHDGKELIIEDFFQAGDEKTKLIIESDGKLYQANYDTDNFTGLEFTSVTSQEETAEDGDDAPLADWVVPAVLGAGALAVAGIGVLIANHSSSDDKDDKKEDKGTSAAKEELNKTQGDMQEAKTKLDQSLQQADNSLKALKSQPDANSLKASTASEASLKASIAASQKSLEQFAKAIEAAKAAGVSTAETEAVYKQMADALKEAQADLAKQEAAEQAVKKLTDSSSPDAVEKALKAAQDAGNLAKSHPDAANIAAADAQKTTLQTLQNNLKKAIEAAEALGINTAAYKAVDGQYQDALQKLEAAMQEAGHNQQLIEAANDAVDQAHAAQQEALALKESAASRLEAALTLKAQVLANNQLDQIDNVNQAIREANDALKAAQQAVDQANEMARLANEAINKIGSEVTDKPQPVDQVNLGSLTEITQELAVEKPMTLWESVVDFGSSVFSMVTNITDQIANSTLMEIVGNIGESIGQIPGTIWGMVTVVGDVINIVVQSGWDSLGKLTDTIGDIFNTVVGSIGDAIGSAFDNIVGGVIGVVNDVLSQINLGDIFNPVSWFNIAKNLIGGVIGESIGAIWQEIQGIPGKIFDTIGKTIGVIEKGLGEEWSLVTEAFSEAVDALFEAFVKNPVDLVLNALLVDSEEFWADPFSAIGKIADTIGNIFTESMKVLTDLFNLPGQFFDKIGETISNIMNSGNPDKVIEVNKEEVNALMKAFHDKSSADNTDDTLVKTLLDSLSTKNGDIDLDSIAPEAVSKTVQHSETLETDNVFELFQQPVIHHDEMTDIAMTA